MQRADKLKEKEDMLLGESMRPSGPSPSSTPEESKVYMAKHGIQELFTVRRATS